MTTHREGQRPQEGRPELTQHSAQVPAAERLEVPVHLSHKEEETRGIYS